MGIESVEATIFSAWDLELRKTLFLEAYEDQEEALYTLTSGNIFDHFLYRKIELWAQDINEIMREEQFCKNKKNP